MRLDSEQFAADPHTAYGKLRAQYGALAPVELGEDLPATLVLGYRQALRILADTEHFRADPGPWQAAVTARTGRCPVLPTTHWQPSAARGADQARLRHAYAAALAGTDLHIVRNLVERRAIELVNAFCELGAADLIGQYAVPLVVAVLDELLGLSPEIGREIAAAVAELSSVAPDSPAARPGEERLDVAVSAAIAANEAAPGSNVISALLVDPARYSRAEIAHIVAALYAMGSEPTWNLIGLTSLTLVTDQNFNDGVLGGSLAVKDAVDEALFTDPPVANIVTWPAQPQIVDEVWLPASEPVVVSLAAGNTDPEVAGDRVGNRSHLAWGAGPRGCPAQSVARIIVEGALDQLLDVVPELALAEPPQWRQGGFHRALAALHVTFPAATPVVLR